MRLLLTRGILAMRCNVPMQSEVSKAKERRPYYLRLLLAAYFCPFLFNANPKLETKIKYSLYNKTTVTKQRGFWTILDLIFLQKPTFDF